MGTGRDKIKKLIKYNMHVQHKKSKKQKKQKKTFSNNIKQFILAVAIAPVPLF